MNLYTLMTRTLALMGMTPDASTLELWRPRLIAWANEGLMDLGISLRLWHKEELEKTMDPSKYTGRASVQVGAFLKNVVNPVLEANKEALGMTAEINV